MASPQIASADVATSPLAQGAMRRTELRVNDFGEWLKSRLNVEHQEILSEFQSSWQSRHTSMHMEITTAFHQALRSEVEQLFLASPSDSTTSTGSKKPFTPPLPPQHSPTIVTNGWTSKQSSKSPPVTFKIPVEQIGRISGIPEELQSEESTPMIPKRKEAMELSTPVSICSSRSAAPQRTPAAISFRRGLGGTLDHLENTSCFSEARWQILEIIFGIMISLNALLVLVEAQYRGYDAGHRLGIHGFESSHEAFPSGKNVFFVSTTAFNSLFTIELVLRLVHKKMDFFKSIWTLLDVFVVPICWFHTLGATPRFLSFVPPALIRMFRVVRLCALVKTMKRFDKLGLLIRSITASIGFLLWSMLVLFFTQLIAGMVLNHMLAEVYHDPLLPEEIRKEIFNYFGTSTRTLLTMFQVVFSNWTLPCWLLVRNVSEWYGLFFVLYRCVLCFGLLATISSMFIAETHRVCAHSRDMTALANNRDVEERRFKLSEFFKQTCTSVEGFMTSQDLQRLLRDATRRNQLSEIDIAVLHLEDLFHILQKHSGKHNGYVELTELSSHLLHGGGVQAPMSDVVTSDLSPADPQEVNPECGKIQQAVATDLARGAVAPQDATPVSSPEEMHKEIPFQSFCLPESLGKEAA